MNSDRESEPGNQLGMGKAFVLSLGIKSGIGLAYIATVSLVVGGCPLRIVLGMPCPGCGLTRACRFALHGNWNAAFATHPLWWIAPVLWILICPEMTKNRIRQGLIAAIALIFWLRWFFAYLV